ncbi:MAG: polymorphic toxin type 44 domain-containing protein [Bacteroidota bacterium]|nr:polymorphic toxin type 44 domain-containing protein [Bacteroidota bacterium]
MKKAYIYTDSTEGAHRNPLRYSSFVNPYRYAFNGFEKDDEVKGTGNSYTTEFRQFDSRIGRWLSLDPLPKDNESPYVGYSNNPIWFIDPLGADTMLVNSATGKQLGMKTGGEDVIFMTEKKKESNKAWKKSEQLFHSLDISGKSGGSPSKKGEPVIWSKLPDHTSEFDQVLNNSVIFWEIKEEEFGQEKTAIGIDLVFEKNKYFQEMVTDNAPFDIKQNRFHPKRVGEWSWYKGTLVRYDDYGNILYGAVGKAFGFSDNWLTFGSHINQLTKSGLDEGKDSFSIQRGIDIYKQLSKSRVTITPK